DQGIRQLGELRRLDPGNRKAVGLLLHGLPDRAAALARLGRPRDADADWDRALSLATPEQQSTLRLRRCVERAAAGDYRRSAGHPRRPAAEVDDLSRAPALPGGPLSHLARAQALTAASAGRDGSRPLPERDRRAERYARDAVALLRRAAAAGLFDAPTWRAEL